MDVTDLGRVGKTMSAQLAIALWLSGRIVPTVFGIALSAFCGAVFAGPIPLSPSQIGYSAGGYASTPESTLSPSTSGVSTTPINVSGFALSDYFPGYILPNGDVEYGPANAEFPAVVQFAPPSAWRAASLAGGHGELARTADGAATWRVQVRNPARLLRFLVESGPGLSLAEPPDVANALRAGLTEVARLHGR